LIPDRCGGLKSSLARLDADAGSDSLQVIDGETR